MVRRSADDCSTAKLFDAYIHKGIDTENAIVLTRASLGLSKRQTEDALRRVGRLSCDMAQLSACEHSAVKLFDDYIQQGIDAGYAIVLTRANLGLSKRQTEDALRKVGRSNVE